MLEVLEENQGVKEEWIKKNGGGHQDQKLQSLWAMRICMNRSVTPKQQKN